MIKEGAPAPNFSLPSTSGETVSLADFRGKQAVVLYFYPKDSTPGCTVEACSFRDNLVEVQELGAAVLGVSPDSVKSHANFTQKQNLNFPLLADTERELANAYGVWVEKKQYGRTYMGIERSTFLIDTDGTIKKIWRKVTPKVHVAEVIAALKS
ncbi:MAG: thioredoxin-dependent thiol peroxidase [Chloroflexota bacterium]